MNLYKVVSTTDGTPSYAATRREAQLIAKNGNNREDVRVELVSMKTDKLNLAHAMNGCPVEETLQTWRLTKRGALVECANGE